MTIQQQIDNKLLADQEGKKDRKRSGLWSPSSFGKCYRSQIYNRLAVPPSNPPDTRTLRIFSVGNIFEKWVMEFLEGDKQVLVKTEDICGYADLVTEDTVYDVKTIHSKGFHWMSKAKKTMAHQKYPNWLQVACYAVILGKHNMGLIHISKDDLCIKETVYKVTPTWRRALKKEVDTLNKWWASGVLPPAKPRAYSGKECSYCGFKDKCYKEEK